MTWTSGVGRACGVLLDGIVRLLALSRINPNVLTLMGLLVNTYAAFLFGYANGENQRRMFFYAGLVIIGSGFFDLVDGRVARASNQVTRFGGFFDSIVDRYSDASLILGIAGLLRSRQPILLRCADRPGDDQRDHGQLRPRPRRIADRQL
jgi:CDP-diacylglycerol--glycerol-3-phosphate 3-phosphatidyltransferase